MISMSLNSKRQRGKAMDFLELVAAINMSFSLLIAKWINYTNPNDPYQEIDHNKCNDHEI